MTVSELIRALELCPKDMNVVVTSYEDGIDDVTTLALLKIFRQEQPTRWYYGQHSIAFDKPESPEAETALLVTSKRESGVTLGADYCKVFYGESKDD